MRLPMCERFDIEMAPKGEEMQRNETASRVVRKRIRRKEDDKTKANKVCEEDECVEWVMIG